MSNHAKTLRADITTETNAEHRKTAKLPARQALAVVAVPITPALGPAPAPSVATELGEYQFSKRRMENPIRRSAFPP